MRFFAFLVTLCSFQSVAAYFSGSIYDLEPFVQFANELAGEYDCTQAESDRILTNLVNNIKTYSMYASMQDLNFEAGTTSSVTSVATNSTDGGRRNLRGEERELISCPSRCFGNSYYCQWICAGRRRLKEMVTDKDVPENANKEERELWVNMWAELFRLDMLSNCWLTVKQEATYYKNLGRTSCFEALNEAICSAFV